MRAWLDRLFWRLISFQGRVRLASRLMERGSAAQRAEDGDPSLWWTNRPSHTTSSGVTWSGEWIGRRDDDGAGAGVLAPRAP